MYNIDEKRNFKKRIDSTILKVNKSIALLKTLRYSLPRKSLITIYKALLTPLPDYGDIIYDQPHNESVCEKLESVQYKVALAMAAAVQGTSREKIYQELGLESLRARRWYKRLSCMFKIVKEEAPNYLINLIPKIQQTTRTRINRMPTVHRRTDFQKFFFSFHSKRLVQIYETIRNSESISIFQT